MTLLGAALLATGCTSSNPSAPATKLPSTTTTTPTPTPTPTAATTFYVDCSAVTAGSGTLSSPWNNVGAIAAHGAFSPGESILLRRGTACAGRVAPSGSGDNGRPITLGAFGTGARPVVNGGGTPDSTGAIQLTNTHDWIVEDLAVTNFTPGGVDNTRRAGILVLSDGPGRLTDIDIRRNVVSNVTSNPAIYPMGGIIMYATAHPLADADTFDNLRVEDNHVGRVGRTGIAVWSDEYPARYFTHVAVVRNVVDRAQGDSILLFGIDGGEISRNVSSNGGDLPSCAVCSTPARTQVAGIWPTRSKHIRIRYNEVFGEQATGGDGEGFDVDIETSDVVVEGNYSHDNGGGGILLCGAHSTDVRYNILQNNLGSEVSFSCAEQPAGIRIYNNDLSLASTSSAQVVRRVQGAGTQAILFANNLVLNGGTGGYSWPSAVTATHNDFIGNQPASQPPDAAASTIDPGLVAPGTGTSGIDSVSGYLLESSSAGVDDAVAVAGRGSYDYFGVALKAAATGRGAATVGAVPAPPVAPTGLVATAMTNGVDLTWDGGDGSSTYRLERAERESGPYRTVASYLNDAHFSDIGLKPAARYFYRIISQNRVGESHPGSLASARSE